MNFKTIAPNSAWRDCWHNDLNEPAVRDMVDAVMRSPENWNMATWAGMNTTTCGTTMCAAGFAVTQAGYEFRFTALSAGFSDDGWVFTGYCGLPGEQEKYSIPHKAKEILGLTRVQSDLMFHYIFEDETGGAPTIDHFVQRVANVTGLEFKIPV